MKMFKMVVCRDELMVEEIDGVLYEEIVNVVKNDGEYEEINVVVDGVDVMCVVVNDEIVLCKCEVNMSLEMCEKCLDEMEN